MTVLYDVTIASDLYFLAHPGDEIFFVGFCTLLLSLHMHSCHNKIESDIYVYLCLFSSRIINFLDDRIFPRCFGIMIIIMFSTCYNNQ